MIESFSMYFYNVFLHLNALFSHSIIQIQVKQFEKKKNSNKKIPKKNLNKKLRFFGYKFR